MKNPLANSRRGFGQLIFPKNGFKIQPPIFLILNPIFELLRGIFWKNELTKSLSGICQEILHLISSILTYYRPQTDIPTKSYTRLKLKKNFCKKAFRQYEWRDPPRGQQLANSTGKSTRRRHVSNSPTSLASPPKKQTPLKKVSKQPPFRN